MTSQSFLVQNSAGVFAWVSSDMNAQPIFLGNTPQDGVLQALSQSLGDRTAIYSPDPSRSGKSLVVGYTDSAPDLPEFGMTFTLPIQGKALLLRWKEEGCNLTFWIGLGPCSRPDQITNWGWGLLLESTKLTNIEISEIQTREAETNQILMTGTFKPIGFSEIGQVNLGEILEDSVAEEVLWGQLYDASSCGDCGPYQAPCRSIWALTKEDADSPGLPAKVHWKLGDGAANNTHISGLTIGNDPNQIFILGAYVGVISADEEAHFYARYEDFTNAGFVGSWSKITSGYVAASGPTCVYAKNAGEIFVGGLGGYIYKLTDVTQAPTVVEDGSVSTEDINAIHGFGEVIVAACDNNVLKVSFNSGETWVSVAGNSAAAGRDLTAIFVRDEYNWIWGDSAGETWLTNDQGDNSSLNYSNTATTRINHIASSPLTPEVVYMAVTQGASTKIFRSLTGGRLGTWQDQPPYIRNLPSGAARYNFVSPCGQNRILTGGLSTTATDGILALGVN